MESFIAAHLGERREGGGGGGDERGRRRNTATADPFKYISFPPRTQ